MGDSSPRDSGKKGIPSHSEITDAAIWASALNASCSIKNHGSCAGFYAAQYLKKYILVRESASVSVKANKVKDQARMDTFVLRWKSHQLSVTNTEMESKKRYIIA
jgi:hypothetical protein